MAELAAFDIETDTTQDGLNPFRSKVLAAAFAHRGAVESWSGPEPAVLQSLSDAIKTSGTAWLAGWNSSRFDIPFLIVRSNAHGIALGITAQFKGPKNNGGFEGTWHQSTLFDVRFAYPGQPSLRHASKTAGLSLDTLDRSLMHRYALDDVEQCARADATATYQLAIRALEPNKD
jgi:hypothetical protein